MSLLQYHSRRKLKFLSLLQLNKNVSNWKFTTGNKDKKQQLATFKVRYFTTEKPSFYEVAVQLLHQKEYFPGTQ